MITRTIAQWFDTKEEKDMKTANLAAFLAKASITGILEGALDACLIIGFIAFVVGSSVSFYEWLTGKTVG